MQSVKNEEMKTTQEKMTTEEGKWKTEMKGKGYREEEKRINEREATKAQMERSWKKEVSN